MTLSHTFGETKGDLELCKWKHQTCNWPKKDPRDPFKGASGKKRNTAQKKQNQGPTDEARVEECRTDYILISLTIHLA